jgi:hypothetical protein
VSHKLPVLFQAIIEHDKLNPLTSPTPDAIAYSKWRERRRELSRAAANFVARQRGSGNAGRN